MRLNQSRKRKRPVACSANQSRERKRPVVLPCESAMVLGWRDRKGTATNKPRISLQRGFTLLEALVATAVLGASVAALLGLLSGSLRNAARMEAPERALLLGQSKLNELISAGVTEASGESRETNPLPFDQTLEGRWDERFRWEARATRFRSSPERTPGEVVLARITLDVFWRTADRPAERKLSFETYQLRREPAEGSRE